MLITVHDTYHVVYKVHIHPALLIIVDEFVRQNLNAVLPARDHCI